MSPSSDRRGGRTWRGTRAGLLALALLALTAPNAEVDGAEAAEPSSDARVVVGSKNFAESRLLAEIFAQLIEARTDLRVERRLNLAGTTVCFEALRAGAIDLYPEYTGTGLVTLLDRQAEGGPAEVLRTVRREFHQRWDLDWLAPLGFENAYELAVPRSLAEDRRLRTISDLARVAPELRAAFGFEFTERPDGLPGLRTTYGLEFATVIPMQQALKVQAVADGKVDVIDVYTTDGRLVTHDLVILDDDRGFFPPYAAAPLARGDLGRRHPEASAALALLGGALDADRMRRLNQRLQDGRESPEAVAADLLRDLGLAASGMEAREATEPATASSWLAGWRRHAIGARLWEHLLLSAAALLLGVVVAVPLGLFLERRRQLAEGVIRAIGLTQTIPSIALLALMIPLLGVGWRPAVVALWIYSLFPILRNTFTGVRDADPAAVEAARALGMTETQILSRVRLPLAAPVLMAGVRTAAVITVGTATLAAFIGAGGLGQPIVTGLQLADRGMILAGALPAAGLALAVDAVLGWVETRLRPPGPAGEGGRMTG